MKRIELLSTQERSDKTCYFCGNRYVKYIFTSDESMHFPRNNIPIPAKVYACNKCAFEKCVK